MRGPVWIILILFRFNLSHLLKLRIFLPGAAIRYLALSALQVSVRHARQMLNTLQCRTCLALMMSQSYQGLKMPIITLTQNQA